MRLSFEGYKLYFYLLVQLNNSLQFKRCWSRRHRSSAIFVTFVDSDFVWFDRIKGDVDLIPKSSNMFRIIDIRDLELGRLIGLSNFPVFLLYKDNKDCFF